MNSKVYDHNQFAAAATLLSLREHCVGVPVNAQLNQLCANIATACNRRISDSIRNALTQYLFQLSTLLESAHTICVSVEFDCSKILNFIDNNNTILSPEQRRMLCNFFKTHFKQSSEIVSHAQ